MGIKFYCPNNHKLNVKNYLAGKKGICPYCNAKFIIPQESTKSQVSELNEAQAGAVKGSDTLHNQSAPTLHGASATQAMPAAGGIPQVPMSAGMTAQAIIPQAGAPPTGQPIPIQAAPQTAVSLPDPFADGTDGSWYMRLTSGDQYGPATHNEMKQWLAENRVTGDSLVWREGWAEWKRGDETFPQFQANNPSGGNSVSGQPFPSNNPGSMQSGSVHGVPSPMAGQPMGNTASTVQAMPAGVPMAAAVPAAGIPVASVPAAGHDEIEESADTMEFLASMGPEKKKKKSRRDDDSDDDEEIPQYTKSSSNTTIIVVLFLLGAVGIASVGIVLLMMGTGAPQLTARQKNPAGNYEILMPFDPKASGPENHASVAGDLRIQSITTDARSTNGYLFYLGYGDNFNSENARANQAKFFEEAAQIFVNQQGGGTNIGSRELLLGSYPGKEFQYQGGQKMRIQVFLVNGSLYIIGVATGTGHPNSEVTKQYFNSFRLLNQPKVVSKYVR